MSRIIRVIAGGGLFALTALAPAIGAAEIKKAVAESESKQSSAKAVPVAAGPPSQGLDSVKGRAKDPPAKLSVNNPVKKQAETPPPLKRTARKEKPVFETAVFAGG